MGMGLAVMESLRAANGRMVNADWETYFVPTSIDAPVVNVEFVEHPEPGIPYGMRGIAELPHVQAPPVVAAAVRVASGRALPDAPVSPDRVSGVAGTETGEGGVHAQAQTEGPWRAPVLRSDVGPWRADLPVTE